MKETKTERDPSRRRRITVGAAAIAVSAVAAFFVVGLLTNIFQRKQEAKNPFLRLVEVTEETTDPTPWGMNWTRQYDGYRRTADVSRTQYGGSEALPEEKIERDPWLKRLFAGYAFAIDYRDRRGHAHMLADQEQTKRVTTRPQPGACLHCHASIIPTYRRLGAGDVLKGFAALATCRTPPRTPRWPRPAPPTRWRAARSRSSRTSRAHTRSVASTATIRS